MAVPKISSPTQPNPKGHDVNTVHDYSGNEDPERKALAAQQLAITDARIIARREAAEARRKAQS